MSVLQRFRAESDFQPLTDSRILRAQLMEWSLNEKNVPKKKRVLFLEDLKNACNRIVFNIRLAVYTFPTDEQTLKTRKHYIDEAIKGTHDVWDILRFVDDVQSFSNPINIDKLLPQLELIYKINNALKKWKGNCKINESKL